MTSRSRRVTGWGAVLVAVTEVLRAPRVDEPGTAYGLAGLFLLGLLLSWRRWWPGSVGLAVLGAVELGRITPYAASTVDRVLAAGATVGALACLLGGVTTLVHGARVERAHRVIHLP